MRRTLAAAPASPGRDSAAPRADADRRIRPAAGGAAVGRRRGLPPATARALAGLQPRRAGVPPLERRDGIGAGRPGLPAAAQRAARGRRTTCWIALQRRVLLRREPRWRSDRSATRRAAHDQPRRTPDRARPARLRRALGRASSTPRPRAHATSGSRRNDPSRPPPWCTAMRDGGCRRPPASTTARYGSARRPPLRRAAATARPEARRRRDGAPTARCRARAGTAADPGVLANAPYGCSRRHAARRTQLVRPGTASPSTGFAGEQPRPSSAR